MDGETGFPTPGTDTGSPLDQGACDMASMDLPSTIHAHHSDKDKEQENTSTLARNQENVSISDKEGHQFQVESGLETQLMDTSEPNLPDEDSLFVSENYATPSSGQKEVPMTDTTSTPDHESKPKGPSAGAFSKIRELQKKLHKVKLKAGDTKCSLVRPSLDHDSHLDTFLNRSTVVGSHTAAQAGDEDPEDKRAKDKFLQQRNHYKSLKQKNGRLTFRQTLDWEKLRDAEKMRRSKKEYELRLSREEHGIAEPASVEDLDDMSIVSGANDPWEDECEQDIEEVSQHLSLQEQEHRAMLVSLDADGVLPKSKKRKSNADDNESQPSASKAKKKSHKVANSKAKGKTVRKSARVSAKQKREQQRQLKQTASLFSSNVFKDQAAEDADEQPTFQSKNKATALKELIKSVRPDKHKEAQVDKQVLLQAIIDFDGRGSVKADGNGLWLVKGMKTSLKPYQVLGTAFMRRRERALEEPRGGLLADGMGLGKTLMCLANIVNGRATRNEVKTTLLIASPNLLTQWQREIETHTDCKLRVMIYGAGSKTKSNCEKSILLQHDIVMATYNEVRRSYPKNDPPVECQTAAEKLNWWKNEYEKERGLLHRIPFYRVILDEAQAIKNHQSETSKACRAIMARYRWALSGTPIMNSLTELYPYFKFLNVPHTGTFDIFKRNYTDTSNPENAQRLLLRLNQFMIRRTHRDTMFGAPILKLPKADQFTHWCDFNAVERNIYQIIQRRFIERVNHMSKTGDIAKSYSNVLVLLLRLRQLTSHVLMLQFVMRDLLEREDIELIRQVLDDSRPDNASSHTIIAIRKQLDALEKEERKKTRTDLTEVDDEEEVEAHGSPTTAGKSFGKEYDFTPYLNTLTTGQNWERVKKQAKCCMPNCQNGSEDLKITNCHHLYCTYCYDRAVANEAEKGNEFVMCVMCGQRISCTRLLDPEEDSQGGEPKKKRKGRKTAADEDIEDDWVSMGGQNMLPSAKTLAVKAQILNWIAENPGIKIIIYTQFLAMIRILARICREEGWEAEQYHGKMIAAARDKAISNFADNDQVRVLLASLRSGGLGLNLTMSSRVMILDPWWNHAAEQQAFCRVFRIGQKEATVMTRFCVRNTVDERLIRMQERKQKEIDGIMDDDGQRTKKLTIRDLMRLFGPVADTTDGKPFIMVDDKDPRGLDGDMEGFTDEEQAVFTI